MSVPSMSKKAATATADSGALGDQRDPLSPADAERGDAEPRVALRHGVQERHQYARPARPDGMPEGNRTAVHVDPVLGDAELAQHAGRLRRDGLVQLPAVA